MSKKAQVVNLGAGGRLNVSFSNFGQPWAAIQFYRSGSADLTYSIDSSNYAQEDVPGAGFGKNPLSGSTYVGYWYAEVGLSGTAFTAGGGAASTVVQLANVSSRFLQVNLSSSDGGQFEIFPWTKD